MSPLKRRLRGAVLASLLVGAALSPIATSAPAGAYPIDANVQGCWKKDLRYYFLNSSTDWPSTARAAMNSVLINWESVLRTNGNKQVDFTLHGSVPPSSSSYGRVKMAVNSVWVSTNKALASCWQALPFVTEEGAILVHPSKLSASSTSQRRLYRHEVGHILGLGHSGYKDNWWNSAKPVMIPGCGQTRSSSLLGDDLAAIEYNQASKSGRIKSEVWASGDPGFEMKSGVVRETTGAVLNYITDPRAFKGSDLGVLLPTSGGAHVRVGVRLANQSDEGADHEVEAQAQVKPLQTPTSGFVRLELWSRRNVYYINTTTCVGKFPINAGGGDVDLSRSYYNPSIPAYQYSNPQAGGSQYTRRTTTSVTWPGLNSSQWKKFNTPEANTSQYVEDWVAVLNVTLKRGANYVPLDIDQFGLRAEE